MLELPLLCKQAQIGASPQKWYPPPADPRQSGKGPSERICRAGFGGRLLLLYEADGQWIAVVLTVVGFDRSNQQEYQINNDHGR